ncbi:MAG: penicillin-binding protein activator [candidate division Zixibacteria bacterium]|nr:penicillin-binding protein activator [candidate division Zixibacteria bacterium]
MALFLLLPLTPSQAAPEGDKEAAGIFVKAQKLLRDKDYRGAIAAFQGLLDSYPGSPNRDIFQYSVGRADFLSGDFRDALIALEDFDKSFPASTLISSAWHLRANCAYRTGKEETAFIWYLKAYQTSGDDRQKDLSRKSLLATVATGYFPPDSLLHAVPVELLCPVKSRMARLVAASRSREQIAQFLAGCPEDITDIAEGAPGVATLSLGVILPLTGPYARFGQALLDGALVAAEELKKEQMSVDILAYDSKADHVTAAREALALAENGADLVIGPLLSDVAATIAAQLSCSRTPLLVPAASQTGFAALSPACFQMIPNLTTIGRGMAQYAVKQRGMKRMAVITAGSMDEIAMADAFTREATRLGGKIVAVEQFRVGETDFGPYIRDLKNILLKAISDSTVYLSLNGDTLSVDEVPVSIDGIFMPANEEELYLLLPQLNFYQVRTTYLGTDSWDTDRVLKLGEGVLGRTVFFSGKAAMRRSPGYGRFASVFIAKYGSDPDYLAALGYDAVNLAAAAFRQGKINPGYAADFLAGVKGYDGAAGRVSFGRGRSNLELPLFTFQNGRVIPVGERTAVEEPPASPADSTATEYIKYGW